MRRIHHLIAAGLIVFLLWCGPGYAQAATTTIFSDGFEYADMTALQAAGWNLTCSSSPCTTDLVSSPTHSGSKALRQTYAGNPYFPDGSLNESNNSKITWTFAGLPDLYERYYVRFDAINASQPSSFGQPTAQQNGGAKEHYYNVSILPNFYTVFGTGGDQNYVRMTNQAQTITVNYPQNVAAVPLSRGVWHCVETHLSQTTIELWVDGTRLINYSGIIAPSYNTVQIYRQVSENLYRYEDDFVIATTRIGCSGSPSADSQPPLTPSGLVVR
jgi:hypothetical protein